MKLRNSRNQEGSALIAVMCIMLVTVALSLTLLLTASILMMNATRSANKEQCRITAVAVSDLLREEIEAIRYDGSDGEEIPPSYDAGRDNSLKGKLKTVVTKEWYEYKPDAGVLGQLETKGKDYFTYTLERDKLPGTTTVDFYWVDEAGLDMKNLDMTKPNEAAANFQSLLLYVRVTNTAGEEASTIVSTFQPVVTMGNGTGGEPGGAESAKWTGWSWNYVGREWERGNS